MALKTNIENLPETLELKGQYLYNLSSAHFPSVSIGIRGMRRIGLTFLNPKVCPSNQSESYPIRSTKINPIRS